MDRSGGVWVTVHPPPGGTLPPDPAPLAAVAARFVATELEARRLAEDLGRRDQEVNLLYGLNELLGRAVEMEETAAIIVRQVSAVLGARRASIMVHDPASGTLRTVAARGFDAAGLQPVMVDDPASLAARVFRRQEPIIGTPDGPAPEGERNYLGGSFLSVPIPHRPTGGEPRTVGVINLTDRAGGEPFGPGERRLVEAIAAQIGIAVEQARQAVRERRQQRLHHELALARDLQRKLLPLPDVLAGEAEVAVLFDPAESVGGDFYTFSRLGLGSVSVMVGDVSSHGLSAALVMAVVLAAAGIHAPASVTPDETLTAMGGSLAQKLASTDSYLTVFHGVLDPVHRRLTYASAGHPHAFRIPRQGPPERLETTAPPLGLDGAAPITSRQVAWDPGADLLCLWTDGLVDATATGGEAYGEARLLARLSEGRDATPDVLLRQVMDDVSRFTATSSDDRTLLILRLPG